MKGWKFSTLFLFAVLVVFFAIYFSDTGSSVVHENDDDPACGDICDMPNNDCVGGMAGDSCNDGTGTCVWFNPLGCCGPTLICGDQEICCQGPGCDPFCDYPGCDPFDMCVGDCGNGIPEEGEQCDDGNHVPGDGCSPFCSIEECGNGVIDGLCGDDITYCSVDAHCQGIGDGLCDNGETCDDGNNIPGDGCDATCNIEPGVECNDGIDNGDGDSFCDYCQDDNNDGICENTCTDNSIPGDPECTWFWTPSEGAAGGPTCGDNIREDPEQCDGTDDSACPGLCQADCTCGGNQYQCSDDQRILKISSETNAHGEEWNGNIYTIDICFDDIFGYPDDTIGDPHLCSADNIVLRLDDITNAHAEIPDPVGPPVYNVNVCFGDLVCLSLPADSGTCEGTYGSAFKEIVSLSSDTNANLETSDSNQYDLLGGYKICCSDGANAVWEWPLGFETSQSYVNSTVNLVAYTGLVEGTNITFDIDECDDTGNPPCSPMDNIDVVNNLTDASGRAIYALDITDSHMEAGSDNLPGQTPELEFYFTASTPGFPDLVSDILFVDLEEGPNNPPETIISDPGHRQIYFNGTILGFNGICVDEDPATVEYFWTITYNGFTEFTEEVQTFDHIFISTGMRTITLRCTDDIGQTDETQIAIVIIASPGMVSFVNEPEHYEILRDDNVGPEHEVDHSATDSYVVYVSEDIDEDGCPDNDASCLAGNCPLFTNNTGENCPLENIPVNNPNQGFDELHFSWTYFDNYGFSYDIEGDGLVEDTAVYGLNSLTFNDKHIELTLSYDNGSIMEVEETNRTFTLGQCLDGGQTYVFFNPDGTTEIYDTIEDTEQRACAGQDGLVNSTDDCCPGGSVCREDDQGGAGCVILNTIEKCDDYNYAYGSEEEIMTHCSADTSGVGQPPAPYDPLYDHPAYHCGEAIEDEDGNITIVQCGCAWSETDSWCVFRTDWVDPGGGGPEEPCDLGFRFTVPFIFSPAE